MIMVVLPFIFLIGSCLALTFYAVGLPRRKKTDVKITGSDFSVGDYLENIEKVHLSILEEQENQEPYIITLWWGLDGCRLNDAGEVEWISRREKPKVNYSFNAVHNTICFSSPYLTYPVGSYIAGMQSIDSGIRSGMQSIDFGIQQMTNSINSSIQAQRDEILRLQIQAAQMEQNVYICDTIRPIGGRDLSGRIVD